MAYPAFTSQDLADYSGRPVASYSNFAAEALKQGRLLFKFATCLSDWPVDEDAAELARYAILSMADVLFLQQPHQAVQASPFQNESIGSYSYSKATRQIQQGLPTGVSWFDLAIERLGVCETGGGVYSGSIGVFENDADFAVDPATDRKTVLGPQDVVPYEIPYLINGEQSHSGSD